MLKSSFKLWNDTPYYVVIINRKYMVYNTHKEMLSAYDRMLDVFDEVNFMEPGERYQDINFIKAKKTDRLSLVKPIRISL